MVNFNFPENELCYLIPFRVRCVHREVSLPRVAIIGNDDVGVRFHLFALLFASQRTMPSGNCYFYSKVFAASRGLPGGIFFSGAKPTHDFLPFVSSSSFFFLFLSSYLQKRSAAQRVGQAKGGLTVGLTNGRAVLN